MILYTAALEIILFLIDKVVYCSNSNQISSLIESFSPCIVHILNFNEGYIVYSSALPVILTVFKTNTTSSIERPPPRTYRRKYVFCAANIILFPEMHLTKSKGNDTVSQEDTDVLHNPKWIDDLIVKTSPLYRDDEPRNSKPCIEQHFLLIVSTKKDPNFWAPAMRYGKISQLGRFFILQILQTKEHTKWDLIISKQEVYQITQISFICMLCSKLALKLSPSSYQETKNKSASISNLESFENEITHGGRKIFIVIGNLQFANQVQGSFIRRDYKFQNPSYLIDSKLTGFPTPFNIHTSELRINEIIEILLFEALDYTNASTFHDSLENYQITKFPAMSPPRRPYIRFQDTRKDKINFNKAVVMMNDDSFNFITCDGTQLSFRSKSSQFSRIFAPYTQLVWIVWILVIALLSS